MVRQEPSEHLSRVVSLALRFRRRETAAHNVVIMVRARAGIESSLRGHARSIVRTILAGPCPTDESGAGTGATTVRLQSLGLRIADNPRGGYP